MSTNNNPRIKEPSRPLQHCVDLQMRFGDYDMFGHLNNNIYLQFFDLGKSLYFNDLTGKQNDAESLGAAVVNINCNFYAPTAPGEKLVVKTACTRIGDKSLTLEQRILNPETGSIKSDAVSVLAGFDVKTQSSAPIIPSLRAAIEQYEKF
jgi:acyl-CoA thioester hydrolase